MTDHNYTGDTPCTLSSLPQTEGQGGQRVPRRVSWLWLPSLFRSEQQPDHACSGVALHTILAASVAGEGRGTLPRHH